VGKKFRSRLWAATTIQQEKGLLPTLKGGRRGGKDHRNPFTEKHYSKRLQLIGEEGSRIGGVAWRHGRKSGGEGKKTNSLNPKNDECGRSERVAPQTWGGETELVMDGKEGDD